MDAPRCPICTASMSGASHGGSDFQECGACGYALLADVTQRADYWPEEMPSSEHVHEYWTSAKRRYFESALELLARRAPGRRLLDVGGGVGFFSELALKRGWDAFSFDISPQARALAAERLGPERALSTLQDVEPRHFDAVTLWCVIAHTRQPNDLVASLAGTLRSGGVIWITTPNFRFQKVYAALRSRVGRSIDFAAEDHVGHFTFTSLTRLLEAHGFSAIDRHFVGVTETCLLTLSTNRFLVRGKRAFNRVAYEMARRGLGSLTSELQVTGRKSGPQR